eukprot:gnl/TRDRNA2_/TRDRNA2_162721_c0_seq1.p1 gnl/TRDRNA2_/TRDRNA2_162721_c0~~gnl/TRDRNA2_/TRDRNA2_162721_c0_seq1.p1  ORF type:complete len:466 (-),score=71.55 gnl/TRDRNA2_/TRDRNA2_162721_c0_seq1:108-1448(-)
MTPVVRADVLTKKDARGFDVVIFRSRKARLRFQKLVGEFQPPSMNTVKAAKFWNRIKENMQGEAALAEHRFPIVAMRDGQIPCAAGFYSDAELNDEDRFILDSRFFSNAGSNCKGATTAILCHLIRNSQTREHSFTPLKIITVFNALKVKKFYLSFGCVNAEGGLWNPIVNYLHCYKRDPDRCEDQVDAAFDADNYFRDSIFVRDVDTDSLEVSAARAALQFSWAQEEKNDDYTGDQNLTFEEKNDDYTGDQNLTFSAISAAFGVVAFRSQTARVHFQNMVRTFQRPDQFEKEWPEQACKIWDFAKEDMEGQAAMSTTMVPMIAMKGESPCAAAFYSDSGSGYVLSRIIRNAGDSCKGGGAAILCHLIRSSKTKAGVFTPLKVTTVNDDAVLKSYYESFGCTGQQGDSAVSYLHCNDPSPTKCDQYTHKAFDIEGPGYFGDFPIGG